MKWGEDAGLLIREVPDWIEKQSIPDQHSLDGKDTSDGVIFLLSDCQVDFTKNEFYYHTALKITSSVGLQNNSSFRITYYPDFEEVILHTLFINRNGTIIDSCGLEGFKAITLDMENSQYAYTGLKSIQVHFDDARADDIIEYSYSTIGRNPIYPDDIFYQASAGYAVPVARIYHRLLIPSHKDIRIYYHRLSSEFHCSEYDDFREYTMALNNVPRIRYEDFIPSWFEPFPYFLISSCTDWQSVGNWAGSLFQIDPEKQLSLRSFTESLIDNVNDPSEKTLKIIQFIQNEIRYLADVSSIYAFKPHDPDEVLKRRYGDCKDKSWLLCVLLRIAGIEAVPALVHTYLGDRLDNRLPCPISFNHCITRILIDKQEFWIDPTIYGQYGNLESLATPDYRTALLLDPVSPGLVKIPHKSVSSMTVVEDFQLSEPGKPGKMESRTIYKGGVADDQRLFFQKNTLADIEKKYLQYYQENFGIVLKGPALKVEDDKITNSFTVIENYEFQNPWKKHSESDQLMVLSLSWHAVRNIMPFPAVRDRHYPIVIPSDVDITHKIKVTLDRNPAADVIKEEVSSSAFSFNMNLELSQGLIQGEARLKTHKDSIEPENAPAYLEDIQKLFHYSGYSIPVLINDNPIKPFFSFLNIVGIGIIIIILGTMLKMCTASWSDSISQTRRDESKIMLIQDPIDKTYKISQISP